jgi:hypothetical protein
MAAGEYVSVSGLAARLSVAVIEIPLRDRSETPGVEKPREGLLSGLIRLLLGGEISDGRETIN